MKKMLSLLCLCSFALTSCQTGMNNTEHFSAEEAADNKPDSSTDSVPTTSKIEEQPVNIVKSDCKRGAILDCNSNVIISSKDSANGNAFRIMNEQYDEAFAPIISDYSNGLDKAFESITRTQNPTPANYENDIGQSIRLTIDANIQNNIYHSLSEIGMIGAVVVMDTDSRIIAEVSLPSYSYNSIINGENVDLSSGNANNRCIQPYAPGSTMKIISGCLCSMHNINTLTDHSYWEKIQNWDYTGNVYDVQRTLTDALVFSSNVYFAQAADIIGQEPFENELSQYFSLSDDIMISCDFGQLQNSVSINGTDQLRRSSFGQGNIRLSPIYLAMATREVMFGDMLKAQVLDAVVDTTDYSKIIENGIEKEVIASVPEEYTQTVQSAMREIGTSLPLSLPKGYTLYAKTGTAEKSGEDLLYITGYVSEDTDPDNGYIVVLRVQNPSELGFTYAKDISPLYEKILRQLISYPTTEQ